MKKNLEFAYTPSESLTIANESINEALANSLDKVASFKNKLLENMPMLIRGFGGNSVLTTLPKTPKMTADENKFLKNINHVTFVEMKDLKAFVPESLCVSYLDYIKVLKVAVKHLVEIVPNVLNPYTVLLAHLVSSKSAALSTNTHSLHYDALETNRIETYGLLSKCFSKSSKETQVRIWNVIDRNTDWLTVISEVKSLSSSLDGVNLNRVSELTKQSEDYLEIIYDNLKNGKLDNISPEATKALATGARTVADELEFFSAIYYNVLTLVSAINKTIESTNEILE